MGFGVGGHAKTYSFKGGASQKNMVFKGGITRKMPLSLHDRDSICNNANISARRPMP